jgi:putative redox protein
MEKIMRHISVRGALSEEQKAKLLEIAKRCPVHRTILSTPTIEDTIEVIQ